MSHLKGKQFEKQLKDKELEILALKARLQATEEHYSVSEEEVRRLMHASHDHDVKQTRAAVTAEAFAAQLKRQVLVYEEEFKENKV